MGDYRRAYQQGGCYFFTQVTYQRQPIFSDVQNVEKLKSAFRAVMQVRPFTIEAIVILPDHLHCIWQLPAGDDNFSERWRQIKRHFSLHFDAPKNTRGEKLIWQRRFWEHVIRDELDWNNHFDYIHYNPVKHGYVLRPADWAHSSFAKAVAKGWCMPDWGESSPKNLDKLDFE